MLNWLETDELRHSCEMLLLVTVTLTVTLDGTRVMPIIALANAKVSVAC